MGSSCISSVDSQDTQEINTVGDFQDIYIEDEQTTQWPKE